MPSIVPPTPRPESPGEVANVANESEPVESNSDGPVKMEAADGQRGDDIDPTVQSINDIKKELDDGCASLLSNR